MSVRQEFTRKVRAAAFERCGGNCEGCGARLKVGEGEYDHILPDVFAGEPTLANCQVLCRACHRDKTRTDNRAAKKTSRNYDKHTGAFKRSPRPIPGSRNTPFRKRMNGAVEWRGQRT